MALKTYSKFYYGHTITIDNQNLPFKEDGDIQNRIAVLNVGSYSLSDFVIELNAALNDAGSQEYIVSLDRITRIISVSSVLDFEFLVTDPEYVEISVFDLMGYNLDKNGSNSYVGDFASGFVFEPQFVLQKYISFEDDQKANLAIVNQSASGKTEVVKYGNINLMTCNVTYQTDIYQPNSSPSKNDPSGIFNLREFLKYITTKANIEVMLDESDSEDFNTCFLESTATEKTGTGFVLKEMYAKKLIGYFETGLLKFRKIS